MTLESIPLFPTFHPGPGPERLGSVSCSQRANGTHLGPCLRCCTQFLRGQRSAPLSSHPALAHTPVLRGRRACEPPAADSLEREGRRGLCSPPAQTAFRNLAWRAVSEAPRRRQAEPTGALGQLPPRTRHSLLLLLKNPPERVYVEPYKLPARAFTIYEKSEPVLGKWGHRSCRAKWVDFHCVRVLGGFPGQHVGSDRQVASVHVNDRR